ncbi:MAG: hypothetical protein L3V56_00925 [Candidatus Magnetoovum sp. WYHC-5]|nr:hypothetical protein [Candidatus Magnetoovum sp. WYHC-5]
MFSHIWGISVQLTISNIHLFRMLHTWSNEIANSFATLYNPDVLEHGLKETLCKTGNMVQEAQKIAHYGLKLFEISPDGYWFSKTSLQEKNIEGGETEEIGKQPL